MRKFELNENNPNSVRNPILPPGPLHEAINSLNSSVQAVDAALAASLSSNAGLFIQRKAFGSLRGPSGEPEVLALIYADDPVFGYWYGHVLQHPKRPKVFVAAIVWSKKLVEASSAPLLFARFHYWVRDRLEYEPCSTQRDGDVYCEAASLPSAAFSLAHMIHEFDLDKRMGTGGTPYEDSPVDLRIEDMLICTEN